MTLVYYVIYSIVSYGVSYALNAIFNPKKYDPRIISPKFEDNQTFVRSAVEPHKIVYGQALVSGPLVFAATNGANNQSLHIVVPLTGHEVEEIGTVYFDDISSAGSEFNKIERWSVQAFNIPGYAVIGADLIINGVVFGGSGAATNSEGHQRIKTAQRLIAALYNNITTTNGGAGVCASSSADPLPYAQRNYTVSIDTNGVSMTISGKALNDEVDLHFRNLGTCEALDTPGASGIYTALVQKSHIFDIYKHLGSSTQAADSNLVAENVGWTVDHRLQGRAYIYSKLRYYADRWPTGIPKITAEVKGKKVYDPRSLLTAWSDNAALCIRDYLISGIGLNARASEIDEASIIAAANICDEWVLSSTPVTIATSEVSVTGTAVGLINVSPTTGGSLGHNLRTGDSVLISGHSGSIPDINGTHTVTVVDDDTVSIPVDILVGGTGGTIQLRQQRYRCNGVITLGERPIDVVQKLLTCCDGILVYTEGVYKLYAGAYTSPVGDLNESHLAGGMRIVAKPPRQSLFNGVRGTFVDKQKYWQETDFPVYKNSTYITQDGEEIIRDLSLPFTTDVYTAQRLAKQILERSRQGILVTFPAKLSAFKFSVNDVIRLSIDHLGWSSKEFRVISWSLTKEMSVDIILQEEASSAYAWNNGDETHLDTAPDTNLPSAFDIAQPTSITAEEELYQGHNTSGFKSRINVSWTAAADTNVVGYVVYWQSFVDDYQAPNNWHDGQSQLITGTGYTLEDVPVGYFYISLKSVNNLGFYSLETDRIEVQVLGKTAPPDDITGFAVGQNGDVVVFTWNPVDDIDLKGYEIRYGPAGATTWDTGIVVTQAERGTEVTSAVVPPGDWTFCIKAQDTSLIYSLNATCRDSEITQSRSIIETQVEDPDFLGVKTNFVHHWTGALVPDSQDLASVDSWDTFDIFVPNPYTTCYYVPREPIDIGFADDIRVWADLNAALGPGETTGSPQPFTELDYHSGAGFDGYEPWTIGLISARYVLMRLGVTPANGVCYVSRYRPNVDVAEQTESDSGVVVPASGLAISFTNQFHSAPSIQITTQGSTALIATYTAATGLGFTAHVYNTDGTEVGGTINWTATGV